MRFIYIIGPHKVGKSTFTQKYFRDRKIITDAVKESSEKNVPSDALRIFMILPPFGECQQRLHMNEDEYNQWMNFYLENVDIITLVDKW